MKATSRLALMQESLLQLFGGATADMNALRNTQDVIKKMKQEEQHFITNRGVVALALQ